MVAFFDAVTVVETLKFVDEVVAVVVAAVADPFHCVVIGSWPPSEREFPEKYLIINHTTLFKPGPR
jgi:hypothetical protein